MHICIKGMKTICLPPWLSFCGSQQDRHYYKQWCSETAKPLNWKSWWAERKGYLRTKLPRLFVGEQKRNRKRQKSKWILWQSVSGCGEWGVGGWEVAFWYRLFRLTEIWTSLPEVLDLGLWKGRQWLLWWTETYSWASVYPTAILLPLQSPV